MGASDLKIIPYSHINYVERLQTAKESLEKLLVDFHYFSHFLYVFLSSFRSVARRNGRTVAVAWIPRRAQYTLIRRKNCKASAYWIKIVRRWEYPLKKSTTRRKMFFSHCNWSLRNWIMASGCVPWDSLCLCISCRSPTWESAVARRNPQCFVQFTRFLGCRLICTERTYVRMYIRIFPLLEPEWLEGF